MINALILNYLFFLFTSKVLKEAKGVFGKPAIRQSSHSRHFQLDEMEYIRNLPRTQFKNNFSTRFRWSLQIKEVQIVRMLEK